MKAKLLASTLTAASLAIAGVVGPDVWYEYKTYKTNRARGEYHEAMAACLTAHASRDQKIDLARFAVKPFIDPTGTSNLRLDMSGPEGEQIRKSISGLATKCDYLYPQVTSAISEWDLASRLAAHDSEFRQLHSELEQQTSGRLYSASVGAK